jgi:hypothetical protein
VAFKHHNTLERSRHRVESIPPLLEYSAKLAGEHDASPWLFRCRRLAVQPTKYVFLSSKSISIADSNEPPQGETPAIRYT